MKNLFSKNPKLILTGEIIIIILLVFVYFFILSPRETKKSPLPSTKYDSKLAQPAFNKISETKYVFKNKEKEFKVLISQQESQNLEIKVEKNGKSLVFIPTLFKNQNLQTKKKKFPFPLFDLIFKKTLAFSPSKDKKSKEVIIENLGQNVELRYQAAKTKLKEEIVLKNKKAPAEYTFNLKLNGTEIKRKDGGILYFYDKTTNQPLFYIPQPFMKDNKGERSEKVKIEVSPNSNTLILEADKNWLNDPNRAYPVIIDPTIELVILNVYTHPEAGKTWDVNFKTIGQANLTIKPMNQRTIDDIQFVSLKCGDEQRTPEIKAQEVIFYPNWSCDKTATVSHRVVSPGKHRLKFIFGEEFGYAYNSPGAALLVCDFEGTLTCEFGETPLAQSGISFTTGYRGMGISLDGYGDYVKYSPSGNIDKNEGTFTAWHALNFACGYAPPDHRTLFSTTTYQNSYNKPYGIYHNSDTRLELTVHKVNGGNYWVVAPHECSQGSWSAGQWIHYAGTWDPDGNPVTEIYFNGNRSNYTSGSWAQYTPADILELWIGILHSNWSSSSYDGKIDEVRIFNRRLSASEIQQVMKTGAWLENGEYCEADGQCLSGNCSCDYSGFDCYCAPAGNCAHRPLVYSNDFSTDPGIISLGNHQYKIADTPSFTNYELRVKWNLESYSSGTFGFNQWLGTCTQSGTCALTTSDAMAIFQPDTDGCGGSYCIYGTAGNGNSTVYSNPQTGTDYIVRLKKNGSSGTIQVYQGTYLKHSAAFTTDNLSNLNRIFTGTWNQAYMYESIYWRSAQKDIYNYVWRNDSGMYHKYTIDDLAVYSNTFCDSNCYGYNNGSTSGGYTCMNGTWSYFKTRFEGVKMEGVKIE